jgi:UDP-N-acetylmuramate dehydrogenase
MNFSSIKFKKKYPLSKLTTFRIGGLADFVVRPKNKVELIYLLKESKKNGMLSRILGGGSNIVFSDYRIPGLTIKLSGEFSEIHIIDEKNIHAGAGASFSKLTEFAIKMGWSKALGWVGIPGTVGGALIMNSGSRFGSIGDLVKNVNIISLVYSKAMIISCNKVNQNDNFDTILEHRLTNKEINFSYRNSSFPRYSIITDAKFYCSTLSNKVQIKKKKFFITLQRKISQPQLPSAGCVFKNSTTFFASKLLDLAGFKGLRYGDAAFSKIHSNFIVNIGSATADHVFTLASYAKQMVYKKFNVKLEFEIKFIGKIHNIYNNE